MTAKSFSYSAGTAPGRPLRTLKVVMSHRPSSIPVPSSRSRFVAATLLGLAAALPAHADSVHPGGRALFIQGGGFDGAGRRQITGGFIQDFNAGFGLGPGRFSSYGEISLSGWKYDGATGRDSPNGLYQLALTPVLRYRLDNGASPYFVEAGIGLTVTNHLYRSRNKRFSTAFQFGDHVGVGYDFGSHQQHEVVLRYEHDSNGSIKKPNPGQNFIQVRYAYWFD